MKKAIFLMFASALIFCMAPVSAQMGPMGGPDDEHEMMLAQGGPGGPGGMGPGGMGPGGGEGPGGKMGFLYGDPQRAKEKLGLTDDQVKKIQEINKKFIAEYQSIRNRMQPKIDDLKVLAKAEKIDAAKIRAAYTELVKIQNDARIARMNHFLEIEQLLTPEQSKKVRKELPFLQETKKMKEEFPPKRPR
jgi:Spy/CpxP family protein refolding chaperone